jgi:hypothetical protein
MTDEHAHRHGVRPQVSLLRSSAGERLLIAAGTALFLWLVTAWALDWFA